MYVPLLKITNDVAALNIDFHHAGDVREYFVILIREYVPAMQMTFGLNVLLTGTFTLLKSRIGLFKNSIK